VPGEYLTLIAQGIGMEAFTPLTLAAGESHVTFSFPRIAWPLGRCRPPALLPIGRLEPKSQA